MLFYHEELKRRKEQAKKDIKNFESKKWNYDLAYDIITEWETLYPETYNSYFYEYITLGLPQNFHFFLIQDFLDQIEETILSEWELNLNYCKSSPDRHEYVYTKEDLRFEIDFYNSHCVRVKTGKMVPEYKTICTLLE